MPPLVSLLVLVFTAALAGAQPWMENFLVNANASEGSRGWAAEGTATTEAREGVTCFTVRNGGSFAQEIELPAGATGQFAVLLGRGQAERISPDGAITGLPYLYAIVLTADRRRIIDYWQGQNLLARPGRRDEWVKMFGVYRVPAGGAYVSVQLRQAEAAGTPHDGSAARFSGVRLYLFSSEAGARAYAEHYQNPR